MALKTGDPEIDDAGKNPTAPVQPVAPPAPAGGEVVAEKSAAGQAAMPIQGSTTPAHTAPRPPTAPPQQKQLPTNIPANQAVFEPARPEFDVNQYIPRLQNAFQAFTQGFGAAPTAAVAHDLARSGLRPESLTQIASDWLTKLTANGPKIPPVPEVNSGSLTKEQRDQLRDAPFISVPNAPFRGVIWSESQHAFLVNPNEPAPENEVIHQLKRGSTNVGDALNFINKVRQTNPFAVSAVLPQIKIGDFAGAALKLQSAVGGTIGAVAGGVKSNLAGTAQAIATVTDRAHDISDHIGNGLLGGVGKTGLLHYDANNPLGVGIGPDGNANTVLGHISLILGEAVSGKHIGAHATLTDEAYQKLQEHINNSAIDPAQKAEALQAVQALNPKNIDMAKQLDLRDRLLKGGQAAIEFGSVANPAGLTGTVIQQSTEQALLENGVNPTVAHIAGDIAGLLTLGKSLNPSGLFRSAGMAERIGAGVTALGGGVVAFNSTKGEDPIERTADVITGAIFAHVPGRGIGRGIDSYRAGQVQQKIVSQALRAQNGDKIAAATLQRQSDQLNNIVKPAQIEADTKLQILNDIAVKRAKGEQAPAPTKQYVYHGTPAENAASIDAGKIGKAGSPTYISPDIKQARSFAGDNGVVYKVDSSKLPNPEKLAQAAKFPKNSLGWRQALQQTGEIEHEGRVTPEEEAAAGTSDLKATPATLSRDAAQVGRKVGEDTSLDTDTQYATALKDYSFAQAKADQALDQLHRQILGNTNTPQRIAWDSANTLINSTLSADEGGHTILARGSAMANGIKVLKESVQNEIRKVLGNDADKQAAFREGIWHPEVIDNISWPEVRQAIIDTRAGLADAGATLPDNVRQELIDNFYPLRGEKKGNVLKSILTPDDPLSTRTGHEEIRRGTEETERTNEAATHPADDMGEYIDAIGQAHINRTVRTALTASLREDGTRAFIPENMIGPNGREGDLSELTGLTNGHKYVWSGAPGMRGLVDAKIAPVLQQLANPGTDIGLGYRAFTQIYKGLAMKSPVHPWNVTSAVLGVDEDIARTVQKGMALTTDPVQLAEALKYTHLGAAEESLYGITENIVTNNPVLANVLDHFRSVNKQTLGRVDHVMWTSYIRNLHAGVWDTLVAKAIAGGAKAEDAKMAAGHVADEIMGRIDPNMMSQTERLLQRYLFFAYPWNRKHITIPAEAFSKKAVQFTSPWLSDEQAHLVNGMMREYVTRQMANSFMIHTMTNLALSGHLPTQNEKGRELDVETTRLNTIIAALEGKPAPTKRTYSQNGFLNFPNWYWGKGQIMSDFGGDHAIQGILQGFSDLSAPIPSFLLTTATSLPNENLGEAVGRGFQSVLNPFQRNLFGPMAVQSLKEQEGRAEKPQSLAQWFEDKVSSVPVLFSGLHQYSGPRQGFKVTETQLRDDRGIGLELARMGVDPHTATADQVAAAKEAYKGAAPFGVNLKEVGAMIGGAPTGTNSRYQELTNWMSDQIKQGIIEQLSGSLNAPPDERGALNAAAEAKYAQAIKDGVSPFKLLDSTHKTLLFKMHPEIGYAMNAPSSDPDPVKRRVHDEVVGYNVGLGQILTANHAQQALFDADYNAGKMTLQDWIKHTQDLRTADARAFSDKQSGLSPAALEQINKKPDDYTPLLPAETAYWNFRNAVSYSDPKFQDENGVTNVKAYKQAQQDFLSKLPKDQQDYIHNRELQSQTPLVAKYMDATSTYSQFRDANTQWENLRAVYNQLTPFEKKIYRSANPQLDNYMTFRDNWFRTDPDGQKAGEFFHPTDEKQWSQWTTSKQAASVAEWYVDKFGSVKQQAYLSPWQKQMMGDKNYFAQLTSKWTEADYAQLQGMIDAYYQEEATYKANSSAYIHNLLNKIFHHTGTVSPGDQNVLGG